jgi:hypothetical protein
MTPYEPRPIRFIELFHVMEWRVKLYGIASSRPKPRRELVVAARRIAAHRLLSLPADLQHYYIAFLGVHDGRTSNFVFLDFWADENELHHHVFVSPKAHPDELTDVTPTGLSACVWDMCVQAFEREAWVDHVLRRGTSPDFDGYLAATLNADI